MKYQDEYPIAQPPKKRLNLKVMQARELEMKLGKPFYRGITKLTDKIRNQVAS